MKQSPETYRSMAMCYIAHKVQLGKCVNYKTNMQFQKALSRLRELYRWLQHEGKHAGDIRCFQVIKLYKPDFYNALPHPDNKSFISCNENLKEIFE